MQQKSQSKNGGLSKTSLLKGIQCPKALYLYKNYYQQRDPVTKALQDKFDRGHRVGLLARELFPGGKDCTPPSVFQYDQSVTATKALIMRSFPVIYEAAFKFEGVLVALDILCCRDGKWYGYEVKSSVRTTKNYLLDAAIQYYVLQKSGLQLEDIFLIHLDNNYVRQGDLDLSKLFRVVSVKEEVLEQQQEVANAIEQAREILFADTTPEIQIGMQCFKPYACDFLGTCWQGKEKSPVLQLAGVPMQDKIDWVKAGVVRLEDVPPESVLHRRMHVQMEAHKRGTAYMDKSLLRAFFSEIRYPLYFFDIEAFQPAIPPFDHCHPFQPIPFQFSAHYVAEQDGALEALEYMVPPGVDGRKAFTEAFLRATERAGQIVVFNTLLEKGILFHLGKLFPEFAGALRERVTRLVDLETPFRKDWYYHPAMQGGYSMKNILPALVPELTYEQLSVKDGSDAMHIYQSLWYETDEAKRHKAMQDLRSYCHLDTLGLYRVFCHLHALPDTH